MSFQYRVVLRLEMFNPDISPDPEIIREACVYELESDTDSPDLERKAHEAFMYHAEPESYFDEP